MILVINNEVIDNEKQIKLKSKLIKFLTKSGQSGDQQSEQMSVIRGDVKCKSKDLVMLSADGKMKFMKCEGLTANADPNVKHPGCKD